MPTTQYGAHKLHYLAFNPQEAAKPPLLLHHGFTSNAAAWEVFRYVEALTPHFRVFAMDGLGHGNSDKPHDPLAYQTQNRVAHINTVLDHAGLDRVHYWGFSMGGWLGYATALYTPERLASLTVAASHPFADPTLKNFEAASPDDPDSFIAAFERTLNETLAPPVINAIKDNDLHALIAITDDRQDLSESLASIAVPATFYAGSKDARFERVREASAQVPHADFYELPGLNHIATFSRSRTILRTVLDTVVIKARQPATQS